MWEKLLNLFKNTSEENQSDELEQFDPEVELSQIQEPISSANTTPIKSHGGGSYNGPGRMIGFNYLKRRGEPEEAPKKFINLGKLLRGNFK
jgi:hypothetical protein